ncbi:hypothetical protein NLC26_02840 [Candidatus Aminicenantes bacterium AC-708-M15]|jgi:hypothetical protein|nr:hypothetical protein [SCandidatus Aminicenantes bacterium Aminicenantia_JdfR_composite]MCP2597653.1 hypothetical protein [Candidatus Aminicenantes bacterium AC-335-G13]MCP2598783.1 hypothetical protein [Candidatus Aminicenantes bacterium AC-335-L06]MCP2604399.1 hypothetical protein [Candidatus Aminicenantes bacterium AC-708-M15]MCP2619044.1 hypothetical protein [Candidatus Aminicenantes bacterium AC-335-A11]
MKKIILVSLLFISLIYSLNGGDFILLQKEISIGEEEADNHIFGLINDVKVDEKGNIYILDSIRERIQKFNKNGKFLLTIGKPKFNFKSIKEFRKNLSFIRKVLKEKGILSDELYFPQKIFYANQKLYILDVDKILIYSLENELLRSIPLTNINAIGLFVNKENEIIIIGLKLDSDRIFHIFNENGVLKYSFGNYFDIPPSIKKELPKEIDPKMIALPFQCYFDRETDELYTLNPFKYEIKVYKGKNLTKIITGPKKRYEYTLLTGIKHYINNYYAGYSVGYIAPSVLIKRRKYLFVFHINLENQNFSSFTIDIFKDKIFQKSVKINGQGYPIYMDKNGYLYCIERKGDHYILSKNLFIFSEN